MARKPETLSSTKLRRQVATLTRVLNRNDTEQDLLADFLGHDIRVHRKFYRLPEGTLQLAKISKVLMACEQGRMSEFKGKSLDQIYQPNRYEIINCNCKVVNCITFNLHLFNLPLFAVLRTHLKLLKKAQASHLKRKMIQILQQVCLWISSSGHLYTLHNMQKASLALCMIPFCVNVFQEELQGLKTNPALQSSSWEKSTVQEVRHEVLPLHFLP